MLKHCAANRKRRLSALPKLCPYIYDVKISGFTRNSIYIYILVYIYDISRLRFKVRLCPKILNYVYIVFKKEKSEKSSSHTTTGVGVVQPPLGGRFQRPTKWAGK
jgi:hypothetical protein